jgi:hypothetical protein
LYCSASGKGKQNEGRKLKNHIFMNVRKREEMKTRVKKAATVLLAAAMAAEIFTGCSAKPVTSAVTASQQTSTESEISEISAESSADESTSEESSLKATVGQSSEESSSESGSGTEVKNDSATLNNGGDFVLYKGNTYYWKYNSTSFSGSFIGDSFDPSKDAQNALICRKKDGTETTLFTGPSWGGMYITDDVIFYQKTYGNWSSIKPDGSTGKDFESVQFCGVDDKTGKAIYYDINDKNSLYAVGSDLEPVEIVPSTENTELDFISVNGGKLYYCTSLGADTYQLEVYSADLTGASVQDPEKIGYVDTGIIPKEAQGLALYYRMDEDNLYISYSLIGGSGFFYSNGGLSQVSLDGSGTVKQLVSPSSDKAFQLIQFYITYDKANKETLYYYGGDVEGARSAYGYEMTPWLTENIYELDLSTAESVQSDSVFTADGDFAMTDGSLMTRKAGTDEYVTVASAETLSSMGYNAVADFSNSVDSCVTEFNVVGDTVYFSISSIELDPASNVGWRTAYARKSTKVFTTVLGSDKLEQLYEY